MGERKDRIAVVGMMHSGKTTLASILVQFGFKRMPLAQELKESGLYAINQGLAYYGLPPLEMEDVERDKGAFRTFWQWFGTDLFRNYLGLTEHWVNLLSDNIVDVELGAQRYGLPEQDLVVDDVRFHNEVAALRDIGFHVVRINRPEDERMASIKADLRSKGFSDEDIPFKLREILNHDSERFVQELDVDQEIWNDGSIEKLTRNVDYMLSASSLPLAYMVSDDAPLTPVTLMRA